MRIAARTNGLTCDSQRCLCWIIDDLKHWVISNKSIKLFISIQTSLTQNAKELKATLTWNKRVWSRNQLDKVSSGNCLPPFDLQQWTFESVRLHWNQFTQRAHIKHYLVVWISELYLWKIPWDVLLNHAIFTVLLALFPCRNWKCSVLKELKGTLSLKQKSMI